MKKSILLLYLTIVSFSIFAQELKEKKEDLDFMFRAEYHVLKSDKKVKQGMYTIFTKSKNKVAVRGNYDHNYLSGTWMFFDYQGNLEQRFDFDNQKLLFNQPKLNDNSVSYQFPVKLSPEDTVKAPIKIGGTFYGYSFVIKPNYDISSYLHNSGITKTEIVHYLNIDESGKIISWKSIVKATNKEFENNIEKLSDFFKAFIPAELNGKNIQSTIIFTTTTRIITSNSVSIH
ncbi:MAG: hypothetical protein IE931_04185 [Sphingobacteriales bacterium]|nr:hypothetical protein [Sphingobacteriales bacterium]